MSYGIRNTSILLLVFILIAGSGYAYMHYVQKAEIMEIDDSIEALEQRYNRNFETASSVSYLRAHYKESQNHIENFDKAIFRNNNSDEVYRFLSRLNDRFSLDFNFVFTDSTVTDRYGVIEGQVSGTGLYRNVIAFINAIENSEPVQKINNLTVTSSGPARGYNHVNFTFDLKSKYDSKNLFASAEVPEIRSMSLASAHNPFFPLIRSVDPNSSGLTDVDKSQLIGVSVSAVHLIDQNRNLVTLRPDERVYLGRLDSINAQEGKASFRLNRGGIMDTVTLKVQ